MSGHVMQADVEGNYVTLVKGKGVYVCDDHGKKYLDAVAGVGVLALGYGVDELVDAMAEQSKKIAYVHALRFNNEPMKLLAQKLATVTPEGLNNSFFCSGGSEALDSVVKIARQYQLERGNKLKYKVIGRWMGFHGNTIAGQSIGGMPVRRYRHSPLLLEMGHIPPANCYHCYFGMKYPSCGLKCAHALENELILQNPDTVAAFIAEPVVGAAAGVVAAPKEYYGVIREICNRYDILFVADEVFCGMGRTGSYFAVERWGVIPDMLMTAKGLSAGYAPLAAVVASDKIWDAFKAGSKRFEHNYTMAGNPVSCAVGLKVLEILERDKVVENAKRMGEVFAKSADALRRLSIVGDVRNFGLFMGIELVQDRESHMSFPPSARVSGRINSAAMENGLIVYPGTGSKDGVNGDHILLAPPLIIQKNEMEELVDKLVKSISQVQDKLSNDACCGGA